MGAIVAGIVAFAIVIASSGLHPTAYNNYVLLAQAFLQHRVWIDWPGPYIDALPFDGKYFVIEAPLPAVLLLPAVALFGGSTNQEILAALLAGVAVGAGWEVARRIGAAFSTRLWLCGFLLLGTDLMWCATFGDVWFIASVSSVAFTMLALVELFGARRGWVVALFAACAIESRFTMLVALPVYAAMLWFDDLVPTWAPLGRFARRDRGEKLHSLESFALMLVPFAILWVAYNYARWGVPYDIGYTAWYHQDQVGQPDGSPFRLMYLPMQIHSFFVQAPERHDGFPYLVPTFSGVALTWTSPALLVAFFARGPWRTVAALWLLALATAAPNFIYYVNGFAQFGMRHALDFEPFLFVLMALALRRGINWFASLLVAYSMLVGAWGIWYWKNFYRHS
jgi:hypothetical protein